MGFVIDNFGVKKSLMVGTAVAMTGKYIIAFSHSVPLAYLSLVLITPLGESLCIPVLTTSVRRSLPDLSSKKFLASTTFLLFRSIFFTAPN